MTTDNGTGETVFAFGAKTGPAVQDERAAFHGPRDFDGSFDPQPARKPSRKLRASVLQRYLADMIDEERRFGTFFVWLPMAMIAGVTVDLAAQHAIPAAAIAGPLAIACLTVAFALWKGRAVSMALAIAMFFSGMAAAAIQIARTPTTLMDGTVVTHIRGRVLSREGDAKSGRRYLIRLASTSDPVVRRPPRIVRLSARGEHRPIAIGAGIAGLARLSPMSGPALPGGYDFGFNAFFNGIGAIGFFYGAPHSWSGANKAMANDWRTTADLKVERLRDTISERIRAVLPGDEGALASALIVAKRRAIPKPITTALRNSGLAHILAISGLHMALVAGTLFFLLRLLLGLSPQIVETVAVKKIAAAAALLVATAYLVLSGGAVSTVRAWVMLAIMLVAVMLDRPALTMRNVAIAAFVIMAANPAAVVGPSFQMSFAATMALVAGYALFRRYVTTRTQEGERTGILRIVVRFAVGIAFTSVVAGAATAIFAAYHFQRIATLGLIGNLLAMPVITFVVMPFGLISVLLMPYGLEAVPLEIMGGGLHLVIRIADHVSALGGALGTGRIPVADLMIFVVGFAFLVLLRSSLRLAGLLPIAAALVMLGLPPGPWRPAILIAEDGKLVGLPNGSEIATNRTRPSAFVFDQWLTAFDRSAGAPPDMRQAEVGGATQGHDGRAPPADPSVIKAMETSLIRSAPAHFTCVKTIWCGARTVQGLSVLWVRDLAYLGPACDIASVVVTSIPVGMTTCRSGALLFTGATLRRSGSVEIDVKSGSAPAATERPASRPPWAGPIQSAQEATSRSGRHLSVSIRTAVGGVIRPWTVQRYYDWRSRSFDFSEAVKSTRRLVISAD